jgi:hypothetical protein
MFFYNMFCIMFAPSYDNFEVFYFEILVQSTVNQKQRDIYFPQRGHPNNRRLSGG